ncbi:MAG TPA: sensor histidine kinase [Nitrospirae bacterium]|nr:sensor histidine kinase [Nitrospirota bacterium]
MSLYQKLKIRWEKSKIHIEIADTAFSFLRLILFLGGIGWLIFSDIPQETFRDVTLIIIYFVAYSVLIYLWLFLSPQKKKTIYIFCLAFDLVFASLLVRATGGFGSSFFNGFYLITALYSFYYGLRGGTAIAVIAAVLYLISGGFDFSTLAWTDFSLRISFLFLIALPLGMLSQQLKKDKDKIGHLNKELNESIEELKYVQGKLIQAEKLSALGRLTADVAHEIRNPLTSIGGFARRLDKKLAPNSREKEYSEIVISEVDRLEKILRDVLTFSRKAALHLEYQDINEPVYAAIRTFSDMCSEQAMSIEKNLDTSLPQVLIDGEQVRQALNNLITNALDSMPKGGTLTINTLMQILNHVDYIIIEIVDTGTGIPREKLNMIFEPFYTTKEIGIGTGLGLSICKKIMDEHNGLIHAETQKGKGTTFRLFFPYQSEKEGAKTKCWEFQKCGIEKTEGSAEMKCPAYPNYGRICWVVAGTFCEKEVSGAIAHKLGNCKKCDFYQSVAVNKEV